MNEGLELSSLLGYQVRRVHMLFLEQTRAALEPLGISPAKIAALVYIRDHPGRDQSALGRALSIGRSSAMKMINTLEERNLVERQPGRDFRSNALHLTGHGKRQLQTMLDRLRDAERRVGSGLSKAEMEQLMGLLKKLRRARSTSVAMEASA